MINVITNENVTTKTYTVLLIGDDVKIRRAVSNALTPSTITIIEAHTTHDITAFYQQETQADLILLDYQWAQSDDFAILSVIPSLKKKMIHVPILLIGQPDNDEDLTRLFERGISDVIASPPNPAILKQRAYQLSQFHRVTNDHERLTLAIQGAQDGLWDWDMVTGYTYFNVRWAEMLGYTLDELMPSVDTWRKLVHPDDMAHIEAVLQAHIERDEPYEVEHRLLAKSGEWMWIRASGKVVAYDDDHKPLRMSGTHKDIDDRKRMEDMLKNNQERLQMLVENVTDIIYSLSFDGIMTYASPNWTEYLGHSLESVQQKPIADFIHPEDLEIYEMFLQEVMETGEKQLGVEFRIRNNDGDWIWHTSTGSLAKSEDGIPVYYVGAMHDITHQLKVKATLAENERRYRIISNTISDYAYSYHVDPDGSLMRTWSTQAFHKITGYSYDEMNDAGWEEIIHPDDKYIAQLRYKKLMLGEVDNSEFRIITKSGETRWLMDHGYPIWDNSDNRVTAIYGAAQDITNRKRYEQALQDRNDELDAFAYTVAHDLKNPIASMMGFASLIINYSDRMPPEQIKEYVELILEGGYQLKNIINALLLLAGVDKMEQPAMVALDMQTIAEQAQRRLVEMSRQSQAKIVYPDHWHIAQGYAPWVEEIWANYISNAIKYGGEPPVIELGSEQLDNGMTRFWVRDNGRGLTEEEQEHVFTPFTRLNQVKIEGHGLGLSVVHRIVNKLGGEVSVTSELGAGSKFSFTLPHDNDLIF